MNNKAVKTHYTNVTVLSLSRGRKRKYRVNKAVLHKRLMQLLTLAVIVIFSFLVVAGLMWAWDREVEVTPQPTPFIVSWFTPASEWIAVAHAAEPTPEPKVTGPKPMHVEEPQPVATPSYTEHELELLARLIHGEACGEPYSGKLAVGTVVINRMNHSNAARYGGPTMEGVIFKTKQFQGVGTRSWWSAKLDDECINAARDVLDGRLVFGPEILYFSNPKHSTVHGFYKPVLTMGNHVFGKEN